MGGKRDMESAQSILKQGSVLQLSCFDTQVKRVGTWADNEFSDRFTPPLFKGSPPSFFPRDVFEPFIFSPPGPNPPGGAFTPQNLDNALRDLVGNALQVHLNNFTPSTLCASMNTLWHNAKCYDYNHEFINFERSVTYDRRSCGDNSRSVWQTKFNAGNPPPVYPPATTSTPPGGLDAMRAFASMLYQEGTTGDPPPATCAGFPPVQTGLMVDGKKDAVCPKIGCWYDASTGTCKGP